MLYTLPVLAYLIGSISSAIAIARLFALTDPRSVGSGNPGATNILRQGNKTAALLTLLGDVSKGVVPVLIAHSLSETPLIPAAVAAAAFIGHLYPVFFRFRGGKGVATGLGVYLALYWPVGVSLIVCWLLVAAIFRYSSLAAIVTSALSPLLVAYWLPHPAYVVMSIVLGALLLWRHRDNYRRLLRGKEDKIRLPSRK
ncbi:MAG: putative glycerol-3-phosphate acyltransferase [Gammaproteobacteria bacterium]|nr:putative glycerol-3-phosphate acyltransferase [Gammaproteobacteria bacterium]